MGAPVGLSSRQAAGRARCLLALGFIANRDELLRELALPPATRDPELIAALYAQRGMEAPRSLLGASSWVLWDGVRDRLVAVRDRIGIHPLYFRLDAATAAFAGSIEELVAPGGRGGPGLAPTAETWNRRALAAHLAGRTPAPGETFFRGIETVLPGEALIVERERIGRHRYWQPGPRPLLRLGSDREYAEACGELMAEVVRSYSGRQVVGVTLSAGLDSSAVAAALGRVAGERERIALCWATPDVPEADESRGAMATALALGMRLEVVRADRAGPLSDPRSPAPGLATPLHNLYHEAWATTFERAASAGAGVVFTGISGDSLFGGDAYSYPDLLLTGRWRQLASEIVEHRRSSSLGLYRILRAMVAGPILDTALVRRERLEAPAWLGAALRDHLPAPPAPPPRRLLPGRRQRLAHLRDPFLPHIAELLDRQAAAFGVELRHPLLDHRLFELAAALPTAQSFRAAERKGILRRAFAGELPAEIVRRRGKLYPLALARYGLAERGRERVEELLTGMRAERYGLVIATPLRVAWEEYREGRTERVPFWPALTLEAWLRAHFAG